MKRLMKQASDNEVINVGKEIINNPESKIIVQKFIGDWLEDNITEYELDTAILYEEIEEEITEMPDNLFEKLIDLVPNEGDDDKLYNASNDEKKQIIELILEDNYADIVRLIELAIKDEELIKSEYGNDPYGPGMSQSDFI